MSPELLTSHRFGVGWREQEDVKMRAISILCIAAVLLSFSSPLAAQTVLIEAEGFDDPGGWVIDQQFMDRMGSPYLLAHGLGTPVEDAMTTVDFPSAGAYRVWVRTRDWVAPWKAPGAPGRFQLLVDGKPVPALFGTQGDAWHWQDGGLVQVPQKRVTLALDDLTGFEGRCEAILFSAEQGFVPPEEKAELAAFRRDRLNLPESPDDAGRFDLVVVGGGIAGACAAISAARLGVQVALIQNRPVLGGNNSSEVRVGLSGKIHQEPYPALGDVVEEIAPVGYYDFIEADKHPDDPKSQEILAMDPIKRVHNAGPPSNYEDQKKLRVVRAEKNIALFLNTHACRVEMEGSRIRAVTAKNIRTGRELRFQASWFADCTGDGNLGFLAGADYRIGRESRAETGESQAPEKVDGLIMGTSVQWYSVEEETPQPFPDCPWAVEFNEDSCQRATMGDWDWETGMNMDPITQFEAVRDHAFRVTYGNWAFLKNQCLDRERYANRRLDWVAYVGGKRESRRLMGDVVLRQQDVQEQRRFPDAAVTATWNIDLHFPAPDNSKHFPGREFRAIALTTRIDPYPIPYRCFYSRNVENLWMAGRNISVTHVALGCVRVQKTTGMMGEVVGMAASLAKKHRTGPRGVYSEHLEELQELMRRGAGKRAVR
jgi:hypothetical protein